MILQEKNLRPKIIFDQSFFIQTVSEEMILQQQNSQPKKISTKIVFIQTFSEDYIANKNIFDQNIFHPNCFRENDFATKKNSIKIEFSTKTFFGQ